MAYVRLDPGTMYEIIRMYKQESCSSDEIAEAFGVPESLVNKILNSYRM